jgi:predicted DNA-binding transcriptional regulator YafY
MIARERIIKVILYLLAHPYRFTKKELADKLRANYEEVTFEQVKGDIDIISNSGMGFHQDTTHWKCAIIPDRSFSELNYLLPLTEEDRTKISAALKTQMNEKEVLYLSNKLSSLYDFQKLGIQALRRPALERLDALEAAIKKKVVVVLENYFSNTSPARNRKVEPFHVDAELDTLQAYDLETLKVKHFRLSRIERVTPTEEAWQYEGKHVNKPTDVFRIADDEKVMVHLQMNVSGFNALVEAFPKSRADIFPSAIPHHFDFQSKVNSGFLGLINFIVGNSDHVEVISPAALQDRVRMEAEKIIKKYQNNGGVG